MATVFIQCCSGYRTSGHAEMRCICESKFVRGITEEADRGPRVIYPEVKIVLNHFGDSLGVEPSNHDWPDDRH